MGTDERKRNLSILFIEKIGIDSKTLASIKKNGNITLLTLEKLCRGMQCTPNDIVRFIDDEV